MTTRTLTCRVCSGSGFFTHRFVAADWSRRLDPDKLTELIAMFGSIDGIPFDRRPGRYVCLACLCEAGRRKLASTAGMETILTPLQLREIWGEMPPTAGMDWPGKLLAAGVPPAWARRSLTSYRERFSTDTMAQKYAAYADIWLKKPAGERTDLVFYGGHGTGKSGLAVAMLRALVEAGRDRVRFASMTELLMQWRDLFRERGDSGEARPSELDFVDRLVTPTVLVLDDVAADKATDFVESALRLIVDKRQKNGMATILTLNLPANADANEAQYLAELLGAALFDRLRESADFWPMFGRSKRAPAGAR